MKAQVQLDQLKAIFDAAACHLADAENAAVFAEKHGLDIEAVNTLAENLSQVGAGDAYPVLTGYMEDWRKKFTPEEMKPEWDIPYRLEIDLRSLNHPHIAITPANPQNDFSANLFVEINHGRPAIHAGIVPDDNVARIHFFDDGIEVVPDQYATWGGGFEVEESRIYEKVECVRFRGEV